MRLCVHCDEPLPDTTPGDAHDDCEQIYEEDVARHWARIHLQCYDDRGHHWTTDDNRPHSHVVTYCDICGVDAP